MEKMYINHVENTERRKIGEDIEVNGLSYKPFIDQRV
jgi:hypothetical protein